MRDVPVESPSPEELAHFKLVEGLTRVRERFDADADDWQYSLLRVFFKYLQALDLPKRLIIPLWIMYTEKIDQIEKTRRQNKGAKGTPMPLKKATRLAFAAAAVTVLKERNEPSKVGEAVKVVAKASGVDGHDLNSFRDNLNRGAYSPKLDHAYKDYVKELGLWPTAEIIETLPHLKRIC